MAILEVKNIKKGFGSVDVLRGVSFSLEKGQVLAIIGSSGSGKTTLLRCLNFLEKPTSGDVIIDGRNLAKLSNKELRATRKDIGMIFQHFNLMPSRTVFENIAFPLSCSSYSMLYFYIFKKAATYT